MTISEAQVEARLDRQEGNPVAELRILEGSRKLAAAEPGMSSCQLMAGSLSSLVARMLRRVGMNGDTFSIKAPKNVLRSLLPFLKGNSLPEEMLLEYSFCS